MRLNEVQFSAGRPIDGYGPGFFRVGQIVHPGSCLVWGDEVRAWGGFEDIAGLTALINVVDVVFVGTGAEIAALPHAVRAPLEQAGLGVEIMNTPAACRTYNVCLAEGRRVAVALIAV